MINIKDKTCLMVLHGNSIEQLEKRIEEFKDFNIVWCGISSFNIEEKYILSKINKYFQIVYDGATVLKEDDFELKVRIPRLVEYLDRPDNNICICTKTGKQNVVEVRKRVAPWFDEKYKNKILYIEDLGLDSNMFNVTLPLYIACLSKLGAKKIVLFGADSGGVWGNSIKSYYKWELVKKDKEIGEATNFDLLLNAQDVNINYEKLMKDILGYIPEVLNVSITSNYQIFPKYSYDEILSILKK